VLITSDHGFTSGRLREQSQVVARNRVLDVSEVHLKGLAGIQIRYCAIKTLSRGR
jgi:hypothetical protein